MRGHRKPADREPQAERKPLRILIVDDHPIVRKGLTELINSEADLLVCGEGATVAEGLARIAADAPDVAIVDLSLGKESGLQLARQAAARHPGVGVLILSMHDELLYAERAIAAGARGYIMKHEAVQNVIAAIRVVASGRTYVSPRVSERIVAKLARRGARREDPEPFERLTERERDVFRLMGLGLATRDIASQLHLSAKTIETYQARIKDKLGLTNSHELIRAAVNWAQL